MFLRTAPLSSQDLSNFAPLINKGISIQIVIFEDPNEEFEYPVFLASYQGMHCHFHYTYSGNDVHLQQTVSDVWNFLNA